jgi:ATP-dependent helicase HrpA
MPADPDQPLPPPTIEELEAVLGRCMAADAHRLARALAHARRLRDQGAPTESLLRRAARQARQSAEACARRRAAVPAIALPDDLPIAARAGDVAAAIRDHQAVVVCGETGSGKSTQIPKICLSIGRGVAGMIGQTQPRRIAARAIASRLAEELGAGAGGLVAHKVRFSDQTAPDTLVKVMTDGILLAEVRADPLLLAYDTIIIDEAHERSLNIDFLLGYLVNLLPRRPDLRVVVTSATIDPDRFARRFASRGVPAPVVEVSGRAWPVEVRYRPLAHPADPDDAGRADEQEDAIESAVVGAVEEALAGVPVAGGARDDPGDVLVFLATEREIRDVAGLLRRRLPAAVDVLPLYARLTAAEQQRVFERPAGGPRRVVLATNVAETSITVPGIRAVIDTGLARVSRYSPRGRVQRLPVEPVSRASADQRAGRCGRLGPGLCIRLYGEEDYRARPRFTDPEIRRTSLASVILQMGALGLGDPLAFPFIDPPDSRMVRDGYDTLYELGAVTAAGDLTPLGREMARLPVDPRLARMILASRDERCVAEVLVIVAALSVPDPRERPADAPQRADLSHERFRDERSDFVSILRLWGHWRRLAGTLSGSALRRICRDDFLSYVRLREWEDVHRQLVRLARAIGLRPEGRRAAPDQVHRALLAGLLSSIGCRTDQYEFVGPRGVRFGIFPGSALFRSPPRWVMAAELVRTSRLYARTVAAIRPQWIERAAAHLLKRTYGDPEWDPQRGEVVAPEHATLFGVDVVRGRRVHFGPIDPATSRAIFIQRALVDGAWDSPGEFARHNREMVLRARRLEAKARRDVLTPPSTRFAFFDSRLPADVFSGAAFERWRARAERGRPDLLFYRAGDVFAAPRASAAEVSPAAFPDSAPVLGSRLALDYRNAPGEPDDGVTLVVPIHALPGLTSAAGDWLVPGLIEEKVTELIRTLPKHLRVGLVPAPEYGRRCAEELARRPDLHDRPLVEAAAETLGRLFGVTIPVSAFRPEALPPHLRLNYRVVDRDGAAVAAGRDLDVLRRSLAARIESALSAAESPFNRDGLTRWSFGDLPERADLATGGIHLEAFPALVDQGTAVGIRLCANPSTAQRLHHAGVLRLCTLELDAELRRAFARVPDLDSLRVRYAAIGSVDDLEQSIALRACERAFLLGASAADRSRQRPTIRRQADFHQRLADLGDELEPAVLATSDLAGRILSALHPVLLGLAAIPSPRGDAAAADLSQQVERLCPPGFLASVPFEWLEHYPRYLAAARRRIDHLRAGRYREDADRMASLAPFVEALPRVAAARDALAGAGGDATHLDLFRWMLEEFRVSLFAQDLGTAVPVSPERLRRLTDRVVA